MRKVLGKKIGKTIFLLLMIAISGCADVQKKNPEESSAVKLITLNPGHFHAALVQKSMYKDVDSVVHVYAPEGPELEQHLKIVSGYNARPENPTHWKEEVYRGNDFLEKMLQEKKGNVVVIAGNNLKKTEYIFKSVEAGFNVLADKPMAINKENFEQLKSAFATAEKNKVLLYDIMTERYEITSILQRELSMLPGIFGELETGTPSDPAVINESAHYFYKYVSGNILVRPPWFMDVEQEGEGVTDVGTHLVDLVQWACFPDQVIDYTKDIQLTSSRRWPTSMTLSQFNGVTKLNAFPDYLKKDVVKDSILQVFCNGEVNYKLRGKNVRVSVKWGYKAAEGAGDSHYSLMRGTKANLIIKQDKEQNYKPVLHIEPVKGSAPSYSDSLMIQFKSIVDKYPGVELQKNGSGWEVSIPEKYKEGHEAHFARVTEKYLQYLKDGKLPEWEVPNMIAKYFTTTAAIEMAKKDKSSTP